MTHTVTSMHTCLPEYNLIRSYLLRPVNVYTHVYQQRMYNTRHCVLRIAYQPVQMETILRPCHLENVIARGEIAIIL